MKPISITCADGTTFATTEGESLKVRYSRLPCSYCSNLGETDKVHNHQHLPYKNTLVTLIVGDLLYYGIARCNLDSRDTFSKKEGRSRALLRMLHARNYRELLPDGKLWGWCPKSDLKALLEHFYSIDRVMNEARRAKYLERQEPSSTVTCKFCNGDRHVPAATDATAHRHEDGWVGDECDCWPQRKENEHG